MASQALHSVATVDPLCDEYKKELDADPHFQLGMKAKLEGMVVIRMKRTVSLKA